MATKNEFNPQIAVHPGRILSGEIDARQMTQKEFAGRIQITEKNLSDILNGKASITPKVALALEASLGTPANVWIKLQGIFDELIAREEAREPLWRISNNAKRV